MSFQTAPVNLAYRSTEDAALVTGTCMLGNDFGQVESCSLEQTGDTRDVKDCANRTRAFLIENQGYKMDMTTMFDAAVGLPNAGQIVSFPLVAVQGIVLPGAKVTWSKSGERMFSFSAHAWNHLSGSGQVYAQNQPTGTYDVD